MGKSYTSEPRGALADPERAQGVGAMTLPRLVVI